MRVEDLLVRLGGVVPGVSVPADALRRQRSVEQAVGMLPEIAALGNLLEGQQRINAAPPPGPSMADSPPIDPNYLPSDPRDIEYERAVRDRDTRLKLADRLAQSNASIDGILAGDRVPSHARVHQPGISTAIPAPPPVDPRSEYQLPPEAERAAVMQRLQASNNANRMRQAGGEDTVGAEMAATGQHSRTADQHAIYRAANERERLAKEERLQRRLATPGMGGSGGIPPWLVMQNPQAAAVLLGQQGDMARLAQEGNQFAAAQEAARLRHEAEMQQKNMEFEAAKAQWAEAAKRTDAGSERDRQQHEAEMAQVKASAEQAQRNHDAAMAASKANLDARLAEINRLPNANVLSPSDKISSDILQEERAKAQREELIARLTQDADFPIPRVIAEQVANITDPAERDKALLPHRARILAKGIQDRTGWFGDFDQTSADDAYRQALIDKLNVNDEAVLGQYMGQYFPASRFIPFYRGGRIPQY